MRFGSLPLALLACLIVAGPASAADPLRARQWGLTMIGADTARLTTDGAGATVAVIDSGAAFDHPDLQGRLAAGPDYVDGDSMPSDGNSHGTHVAGIVAANAGNGVGVESVAPGARVQAIRVLADDGTGEAEHVAAAIRWATDNGADVINLSLGPEIPLVGGSEEFDEAIDRALDRGLVVVAAAGNGLLGEGAALPACEQPSSQGRLLCVGAVDRDQNRAFYSNFGDGLSISAPGGSAIGDIEDDILSTVPKPTSLGPYDWMAGTSQATPHVAGVAALLASLGVRGQAATQRILATARDVGLPGPDAVYGAGIVDARAAVAGLSRPGATVGGGSSGGGGTAIGTSQASARIFLARRLSIRSVLRRGIPVGCLAAGNGRCRVNAYAARRRLAAGSRAVTLGRRVTTFARLTRRGRLLLRLALARRRTVRTRVYVSLPGSRTIRRTLLLRP